MLGFPSNDFGGQEPGSAEEIAALNEKLEGFRVLAGIEVNIQPDGSLLHGEPYYTLEVPDATAVSGR